MARKKIRKKDLREPDEFISISTRILAWCRDNMRIVLGLLIGIVAILLSIGGIFLFRSNQEAKARDLYAEALALYPKQQMGKTEPGEYDAATAKLEELQKLFGSTTVANSALVDLGNAYFQNGDYDKAISCYRDFLQRTEPQDSFRDQVMESLGQTYEAKGSLDSALEVYKQVAQEGSPVYQTQAELSLGRVYEAKGDQSTAMEHYENYLKGNPVQQGNEWIQVKLQRLRLAEPAEEAGESVKEK